MAHLRIAFSKVAGGCMMSAGCERRAAHLPELNNVRVFELLVVYDLPLYILCDLVPKRQRQRAVCASFATEEQQEQRFRAGRSHTRSLPCRPGAQTARQQKPPLSPRWCYARGRDGVLPLHNLQDSSQALGTSCTFMARCSPVVRSSASWTNPNVPRAKSATCMSSP